jgi:Protein of unknown function (DUF4231)
MKRAYYTLSLLMIGLSASTAFVAALGISASSTEVRSMVAVLSLLTAITTGVIALLRPLENWTRRSVTLERIKFEGRMRALSAGPYRDLEPGEAFRRFAENIERIVSEHKDIVFRELTTQHMQRKAPRRELPFSPGRDRNRLSTEKKPAAPATIRAVTTTDSAESA